MQVYFESFIQGEDVKIGASLIGPLFKCETNLRVYVLNPDNTMIALYDYTDDIDEIEKINQQALDEIESNKYGE